MTYAETFKSSIDAKFRKFDRENPIIYKLFKKYVRELVAAKVIKTSSKLIINRIRWEIKIRTIKVDAYKINDAFTSRYSRKYIKEFPRHSDLFFFRALRS